jgi:hypothetical protein
MKASESMNWQKDEISLEESPREKKQENFQGKSAEEVAAPASYASLKDEVGDRLAPEEKMVKAGLKKINDENKNLTDEEEASHSKTLLGSALKNAGQSINKGIGIDEKELMEKLQEVQQKGKDSSRLTPPGKMRP